MRRRSWGFLLCAVLAFVAVLTMGGVNYGWADDTPKGQVTEPAAQPAKTAMQPLAGTRPADAGPTLALTTNELAWRAVERIDSKIANTMGFMTLFVALIAFLLGLYEFFKIREVEDIRAQVRSEIGDLVRQQYDDHGREYQRRLSEKLLEHVDAQTHALADQMLQLAAVSHRVMLAYVLNDLGGDLTRSMTLKDQVLYVELERALGQLRACSEEDNLVALSLIHTLAPKLSRSTAAQLLAYLVAVQRAAILHSWTNQDFCRELIHDLERQTGISKEAASVR